MAQPGQAQNLRRDFMVSGLRNVEDGRVCLRIVSEARPMEGAIPVLPTLEDVYLYGTGGER